MPVTFSFQEKKYKIHAFVDRQVSDTPNDNRLYITVALRFEGLKGRSVFSGTAIAVPQDWAYYEPGGERNRITKKGVQLALNRAITGALNDTTQYKDDWGKFQSFVHRMDTAYETRRKDIASAFWKEFLNYVEEL